MLQNIENMQSDFSRGQTCSFMLYLLNAMSWTQTQDLKGEGQTYLLLRNTISKIEDNPKALLNSLRKLLCRQNGKSFTGKKFSKLSSEHQINHMT